MKKSRIVIPALGLIALGTAASITGTVAWFTANNSVKVTGMTFTTQAGNNLLIADNQNAAFTDAEFKESLAQNISAKLEPVSSVNGVNFFFTTLANDDGSTNANSKFYTYNEDTANADASAKKTNYDDNMYDKFVGGAFDAGSVVYGYVDYTFYLKATYTAADQYLIMNECNIKYNNAALANGEKAWRVAVFAAETTKAGDNISVYSSDMTTSEKKAILAISGAQNFSHDPSNKAVSAISAEGATDTSTNITRTAVSYGTWDENHIAKSTAAGVKYYKVVVRLWLEGEDDTCYVDKFKTLTLAYSLNVGFTTNASTSSAVTTIGSAA